jgi:hypothetical protein
MSLFDDLTADLKARVDAHEADDRANAEAAASQLASMTAQRDEIKDDLAVALARIAVLEHPDEPDPDPEPDPEPARPLIGMNFQPSTRQPQETRAEIARIYVDDNRTDIEQEKEFVAAYDDGVRDFWLSWKQNTVPVWFGSIPSDARWMGTKNHEPEDNITNREYTLAQWKSWQATHLPAIEKAGGEPWICLMAWTWADRSGRRWQDYVVPGIAGLGIDLYPANLTYQKTQIDRVKESLPTFGVDDWALGEYGVPKNNPTLAVQLIQDLGPRIQDAKAACYWSAQRDAQDTDFHFSTQSADAWFKLAS